MKKLACGAELPSLCLFLGALVLAPSVHAGGTKRFELDGQKELSAGKLEGVAVESTGQVVTAVATTRISLPDATLARALLTTADGTSYIGTGTKGLVYRLQGNALSVYAQPDAALSTALAHDGKALFIGVSPGARILKATQAGQAEQFCKLPNAEHIWAMVYDPKRRVLFAATGPEGRIFSVDAAGKASLYYEGEVEHILSLALGDDGTLYAGTSDEALLLAITAPGKARVLHDFDGDEVTALAIRGGTLIAAESDFPKKKAKAAKKKSGEKAPPKTPPADLTPAQKGTGILWRVEADGSAHKLLEEKSGHITAVAVTRDGHALAAVSKSGKVYRVHDDGTSAVWLDVEEKDILALDMAGSPARFVTGDGAAVYTLSDKKADKGVWMSDALDAKFVARFGALHFRGQGAMTFQTRSGNTKKPDDTWSAWSTPVTSAGPIRSPAARFLQIRANLSQDAVLYAVSAHYLPANQAPIVQSVEGKPRADGKKKEDDDKPTTVYHLEWKVENPDGDELRYRVYYRPEGAKVARPMFKDTIRWTQTKLDWNTQAIADGYYRVEVEASDELDNPAPHALRGRGVSEPILVDNHAPTLAPLTLQGRTVRGMVKDALGPIESLYYKLDNESWAPLAPEDGMLDTAEERFAIPLPTNLGKGPHVIAVHATDTRHNPVTTALEFEQR